MIAFRASGQECFLPDRWPIIHLYHLYQQLKQDGKIGWLEFLQLGDDAEDFRNWCEEHGEQQSEENAELFIEMQEYWVMADFNEDNY